MRTVKLMFAFLAALALASVAGAQESRPALLPVPHYAPQNKAELELHKRYTTEFKDHTAEGELALAKTLRDASTADDDPAMKFVMLKEARDLAVFGGNFSDSFIAIDMIANTFDINAHDMKTSALALGMDGARLPPADLIEAYVTIANDELINKDVDLASKAMLVAYMVAHNSGDRGLMNHVKEASEPIDAAKREQTKAINAERTLQTHPDDPQANLIVGSYVCGQMERWKAGLPFLAKCGNAKLVAAAQGDLANPADAAGMADVGDAWWAVADADAIDPAPARRRAAWWYTQADPGLTGDRRKLAEERIAFAKK
jgi:hypothetical protein